MEAATEHFWLWSFLGRLHPMIVHFPVGLLVFALVMEIIGRKSQTYNAAIKLLVYAGALSAIIAVAFGLLLSKTEEYGSNLLSMHQWTGIATMLFSIICAWSYRTGNRTAQKILLGLTVAGVTIAGHYGASLTHGDDYLSGVLPGAAPDPADKKQYTLAVQEGPLSEEQVQELTLQVRTILAHNCYNCHGSAKVKGELRLDTREFIMKGGEHGEVLVPGDPKASEMIHRVSLPRSDKKAMPSKGKGLTKEEIAILEYWIKKGAPWPSGELKSLYRVAELAPRMPEIPSATKDLTSPIDLFVNEYFRKNKIEWKTPVDDRTYIRRVYLDVTGLIPSPDSVDVFVNDKTEGKREALVSRLLDRNDDYAQHWLSFWNDALRNDYTGTGYITGGRWDITKWLYSSLNSNKPYNTFVQELISPSEASQGFIKGIKWRGTVNASQRTEMQAAQNVAQVFLGLNLKCASCHDSFISDWKLDDAYAFANLFSDSILEVNRCDKPTGRMAGRRILYKELGEIDAAAPTPERLKQLADYLVQPKDGRLYRTVVNRIWAQVMGRGIVEPVDVMDNEPWSQDLLDWMAADFTATGYDIKKLLFKILTSRTYQLPSVSVKQAEEITAPDFVFTGMLRRRLTAEEFADAVSKALEPVYPDSEVVYRLLPEEIKNEIPFARAALVENDGFQTALGRPNRETVSTSRASQASLLQALELTNGAKFNDAMKRGAAKWKNQYPQSEMLVKQVYRNTIGRLPDKAEEDIAVGALGRQPTEAKVQDFMWAMALHPEFQLIY
ncbi:MAG: hypothetical protein BGP14_20810 [Sphingobacteriales bacterium 44-15]|nr:MAG: hypothetical protein BGP14_20810 [Sphingobacteriales bacterium 44-15]